MLGETEIWRILKGVCVAVSVLHAHTPEPLAHRDIKAANVLIADDDAMHPILIDFGSVAQVTPTTTTTTLSQKKAAISCSMMQTTTCLA